MALGAGILLYGAYIPAKAVLAQTLLEWSWAMGRIGIVPPAPWPWADTRPVARIEVPRLGKSEIVLEGAHGRSLPFGPGLIDGTALPGEPGQSVVAAHRDTHFKFLRYLRMGERIVVERPDRTSADYWVVDLHVLDTRKERLTLDHGGRTLTLVTCFPFDGWMPGGPLRYIVTAVGDDGVPAAERP